MGKGCFALYISNNTKKNQNIGGIRQNIYKKKRDYRKVISLVYKYIDLKLFDNKFLCLTSFI